MMRVGDCYGERVGGVGAGNPGAGKQPRDHGVDLRLLGIAVPDHRLFDQPRGIFAHFEPATRGDHDYHAARLAEFQRRLRVLIDEHFFDCGTVRPLVGDESVELVGEMCETARKFRRAVGLELPVGEMAKAIAVGFDQPPAGGAEARIEAEDLQPSLSSSSSGTS